MAARVQARARLVESDVRIRADAEQQQVHPPERGDLALESLAFRLVIARAAIQKMDVAAREG